jgi:hypothetical protein
MSKTVNQTHITGEEGVNAFATYCNKHRPYIIWREETKNDFGIDGEVELTYKNDSGKIEPTGKIIKIQLKSTHGGYITKETDVDFTFNGKQKDIEYWRQHQNDVVLVVYIAKEEKLYARKILQSDYISTQKNIPIVFSKTDNFIEIGKYDFAEKFSNNFKNRINYHTTETLISNIFKINIPKWIYSYATDFRKPADIYEKIGDNCPNFALRNKRIYLFNSENKFPDFSAEILMENKEEEIIQVQNFIENPDNYRIAIELLNKSLNYYLRSNKIGYNKKYKRYFFWRDYDKKNKIVKYSTISGKRKSMPRTVVSYHEYGYLKFFKHFAFETHFYNTEGGLFLVINPQYLFTKDGKEVIDNPKDITKLTNYLTARERNEQLVNHIHFIYSYLAKWKQRIEVIDFENEKISIAKYIKFKVDFGIANDNKKTIIENNHIQKTLF